MGNHHSLAPYPASIAHTVENLGQAHRDVEGIIDGYEKSHFCLGHLEFLLLQLKHGSKHVMVKLCNWNIAENHLIPIIITSVDDRSIVMAAVNLLSIVTKPLDKSKVDDPKVLEGLQAALPTIFRHFDDTLQMVEGKWNTEDDWNFVQSVLLFFRNILLLQEISITQLMTKDDPDITALGDDFLGKIFSENLMNEILFVTSYIDYSRGNSGIQVHKSTFFGVVRFASAFKGDGNSGPVLPLSKETMKAILIPFSAAAIVAIATLNTSAAKTDGLAPVPTNSRYSNLVKFSRGFLAAMPYLYVPVGLFGIVLSVGASVNGGLVGFASGFMLLQFLYIIFVGALAAFVKTGVHGWIDGMVAILLMLLFIICWGTVFKYPQCLSTLVHERVMAAFRILTTNWERARGSPRAPDSRVSAAIETDLESSQTECTEGEESSQTESTEGEELRILTDS